MPNCKFLGVSVWPGLKNSKNLKNYKKRYKMAKNYKIEILKKRPRDTNSINIYAKFQVSRCISVARIKKLQKSQKF